MLHPFLKRKLPSVLEILKKYRVKRAYAFGSVVTDAFNVNSDIDLLITLEENLEPGEYADCFWGLYFELPEILERPVDLVMSETFKNPYFQESLDHSKELIYEPEGEEVGNISKWHPHLEIRSWSFNKKIISPLVSLLFKLSRVIFVLLNLV